jgi:hypothetical protein
MVEKSIKILLNSVDNLFVPGLGWFLCSYESAAISASSNRISPPFKKITFNSKLNATDTVLRDAIAKLGRITKIEAQIEIDNYAEKVKSILNTKHQYEIEQIGRLFVNKDSQIALEQFEKINYLAESYGLPDIYIQPLDRTAKAESEEIYPQNQNVDSTTEFIKTVVEEEIVPEKPVKVEVKMQEKMVEKVQEKIIEKKVEVQEKVEEIETEESDELEEVDIDEFASQKVVKKKTNLTPYYTLAFCAFLITAATTYYLNMDKKTYSIGSFSPLTFLKKKTPTEDSNTSENKLLPNEKEETDGQSETELENKTEGENSTENQDQKSTVEKEKVAVIEAKPVVEQNNITNKTGRYFVIMGGFQDKSKASSLREKLVSEGKSAKIIEPYDGNNVFRVSISDFEKYEDATSSKENLKPSYGESLWILHY